MTHRALLTVVALGALGAQADAVIFASTGDASFNSTAPTGAYANSGWQYQGQWMSFTGTPISPQHFLTAQHISGAVGTLFTYQGASYTTDSYVDVPGTDLRIWHVTTPFPNYAPLYTGSDELNKEAVVFGRGTQRGSALEGHGWLWGQSDGVLRWGTNLVSSVSSTELRATFDLNVSATEATLSVGDSGGAMFILDSDGIWKLAGINFTVSGPYKASLATEDDFAFNAALYDQSGYFEQQPDNTYAPATGPGVFVGSRISTNASFIQQVTGIPEPSSCVFCSAAALGLVFVRARRSGSR